MINTSIRLLLSSASFALLMSATLLTSTALLGGCDAYPKDPDASLALAKQHGLRVGAVPSSPWVEVTQKNQVTSGSEVELIKGFASYLNTEVEWITGSESELLPILEVGELHFVIGGLTNKTPWRKRIALTNPYKKETTIVCSTNGTSVPKSIENLIVGVVEGSVVVSDVKKHDATPLLLDSLSTHQGLVAVEEHDAAKVGCGKAVQPIASHQHVIALPKGENALLMALEKYINDAGY